MLKVEIYENQYRILIQHVVESLETGVDKKAIYINTTAQYGDSDAFYEALGSYSMFYSCNTWTNDGLKKPIYHLVFGLYLIRGY